MAENWYYAEGERSLGPIALDELQSVLSRRRDALRVLVWKDGLSGWTEAGAIPELAATVAGLPPLPQRPALAALPDQRVPTPSPDDSQAAHREKEPPGRLYKILGWSFGAISLILSRVFGVVYWLPVLLIALSVWALTSLKLRQYTVWMFGVLIGHTLWMLAGFATLYYLGKPSPEFATFIVDLIAVACLSVWGIRKQSAAAAIGVLIYEILALLGYIGFLDQVKVPLTAVFMHVTLRLLGIGLAIYAIIEARRLKRETEMEPAAA